MLFPPALKPAQKIAVVSPSMAGPAYGPEVHEQAMRRLRRFAEIKEYPSTRQLGASAYERARDINAAFADPEVGAIMSTLGGSDQVTILPHLDPEIICAKPKAYFGYSDNTHLLNWLWRHGIAGFYGGATQVQLGPGPHIDPEHQATMHAALFGGELELTNPKAIEDHGFEWSDPRALSHFGQRYRPRPWTWSGPEHSITALTWGGCVEVLRDQLKVQHVPPLEQLKGSILLLENASDILTPLEFGEFLRDLGEAGILGVVQAVLFARPPASSFDHRPSEEAQEAYRQLLAELTHEAVASYNPKAMVCCGVPFGHSRPQWILPFGGALSIDGHNRRIIAHYSR